MSGLWLVYWDESKISVVFWAILSVNGKVLKIAGVIATYFLTVPDK